MVSNGLPATECAAVKNNQAEIKRSPTMADQREKADLADTWAQLGEAAKAGDTKARDFLLMFGPFVAARLRQWPRS